MSAAVNVLASIASSNVMLNSTGNVLAGSSCVTFCSIIRFGLVRSYKTVLSVLLEAPAKFAALSETKLAAILGTNVPVPVTAVACRVKTVSSPEFTMAHVIPVAVPFCVMSAVVNVLASIALLNVTVNSIGKVLTGSDCPTF